MNLRQRLLSIGLLALWTVAYSQDQGIPYHLGDSPGTIKTIEIGTTEILNQDLDVDTLIIKGLLKCPDYATSQDHYRIRASSILVEGQFHCGQQDRPFAGKLTIELNLGRAGAEGSFIVGMTGRLELIGSNRKSSFSKLAKDLQSGESSFEMTDALPWERGDTVVIGSTSLQWEEAERFEIAQVEGRRVTLLQPTKYFHNGTMQPLDTRFKDSRGQTLQLDNRAEIANLTRNIKVTSIHASNQKGGHIMVHQGGQAFLDAVELQYLGRLGEMGRYPFHWHLAGNVEGQFIRNSSIHDSFQRCVTIHGTQNARVERNVCYNHFGHGFFLEDGNETGNTLRGNLGILTKKVPEGRELLKSDRNGQQLKRFIPSATYWISNPDNTIVDNIASGSQGTGFWMAFEQDMRCGSIGCRHKGEDRYENLQQIVRPVQTATKEFSRNVAHSAEVGMTWDGAPDGALTNNPLNPYDREIVSSHYAPPRAPIFNDLLAYMNRQAGIYFRGNTAIFKNAVLADNNWSFFVAYNQKLVDSVIVAQSPLYRQIYREEQPLGSQQPKGVVIYDGPFELKNIDFLDFPESSIQPGATDITPVPFGIIGGANRFTNSVLGLRFSPEPFTRVAIKANDQNPWADSPYSWSLRDLDGSLTGKGGSLLVSLDPFVNEPAACQTVRAEWNAAVCEAGSELGNMFIDVKDQGKLRFKVTRINQDGTAVNTPEIATIRADQFQNKFGLLQSHGSRYQVVFKDGFVEQQSSDGIGLSFRTELANRMSPLIHFKNFGSNCTLQGLTELSEQQLVQGIQAGYRMDGRDLSFRFKSGLLSESRAMVTYRVKCSA